MKSTPFARRVNVGRLRPVIDAGCARRSDPDEQAPPCPKCRSAAATLWFIDRRTTAPRLVCLDCDAPPEQTNEFPEADILCR